MVHYGVHLTLLLGCWAVKWEALSYFAATEKWFKKNGLSSFSPIGKGSFEKWKSKILKTEIPSVKITKISDLPNAPELEEEAEKEDVRPQKERW
jgi:hypothetical protein